MAAQMSIAQATRAYEAWLARQVTIVPEDLRHKHRKMAHDPFTFLRGTFYRWLQVWPVLCAPLAKAPRVLAVGDLHVENFGTWRDAEGRLVWGINDVDEACALPYTLDLVRLATSVELAIRVGHIRLAMSTACAAILDGYTRALTRGGRPIVLAERRQWLRDIAMKQLRDPEAFWMQLSDRPRAVGILPRLTLVRSLPRDVTDVKIVRRVAGVGSLGRQRFVGLALWGGCSVAREAKALAPSAASWIDEDGGATAGEGMRLLERAVRVPDPFLSIEGRWVVRRLAPDCTKIEMDQLPRTRDDRKLLRAMGWETANLHLATRRARILEDVSRRPASWLERAALLMSRAVRRDWREWVSSR